MTKTKVVRKNANWHCSEAKGYLSFIHLFKKMEHWNLDIFDY